MTALVAMLIAITGDSHALGAPGAELAALLRARGHLVVVVGRIGATSLSCPWPAGADRVVAFLGSNEAGPGAALAARYGRLRADAIIGPPRSSRAAVQRVGAALAGLPRVVDSRACTDLRGSADGLHYAGAAARRWAACVLPAVLALLRARS